MVPVSYTHLQRIHKPLVLCFVLAVLTDKPVQLHRRGEQFEVGTEYKRFVDSLKASVLTAFYTPKEITDTIARCV